MPTPLADNVSATLRADFTAALGALMVIASAHAELFAWVAGMVATPRIPVRGPRVEQPKARNGATSPTTRKHQSPSGLKAKHNGTDGHLAHRREVRDRDDKRLLEAMRDSPQASIRDWAESIGKARSSVDTALARLRDAGLVSSSEGKWRVSEPPVPREPAAKWVRPIAAAQSGAHVSP